MIDFPASPTIGQTFTAAGVTWTWDGTKWTASGLSVAYLPLAGGTLTGPLVLAADPAANLQPVTLQYFNARPMIGDNRIINGDMRIDQRNNGASGSANGYPVDRWQYSSNQVSKGNWQRNPNAGTLPAFPYGLLFVSTSAYTPLATDFFQLYQLIEADMISDFAWGTPNAQPVTLSFWVYSTLIGTHSGAVNNNISTAGARSYPFTFSIPTASTWTRIALTIPGDTAAGAWVISGNSAGMSLAFDLGSGANYRGTANAWTSAALLGVTGAVRVVSTNAVQFLVTGVKLEIGSVATPFNRYSLAKCLADCQRYYQSANVSIPPYSYAANGGVQLQAIIYALPVTMRALPTILGGAFNNGNNIAAGSAAFISTNNSIIASFTANAVGGFWATAVFTGLSAEL